MSHPRAFVTRAIPEEALDLLASEMKVEVWAEETPPTADVLRRKAAGVDGIFITIMDKVDGHLLDAAPRLKVISQMAVGLDNVDLTQATHRRIPVGYTPGVVSEATADQTLALLLAAARRIPEANHWVKQGNWEIAFHPLYWLGSEVHHTTLGIIGMGKIGMEVAKRARGFDMQLLYNSRSPKPEAEVLYGAKYTDLRTLLKSSDYVTLHVPLTTDTRHLIGEAELRMMKRSAILVNVDRGSIVNAKALYKALKERWIAGAALDVTDPEPICANDPLLTLENLVVVPHLGSSTVTTRTRMAMLAAKNLMAGLRGEPLPHCANPEVYSKQ